MKFTFEICVGTLGGVEGSYFMPVEWDPRPAIAQTLAPEQGPQQPSPNQGHRRPYNGTLHLCLR